MGGEIDLGKVHRSEFEFKDTGTKVHEGTGFFDRDQRGWLGKMKCVYKSVPPLLLGVCADWCMYVFTASPEGCYELK